MSDYDAQPGETTAHLEKRHVQLLKANGISEAVWNGRGYYTVETKADLIRQGFSRSHAANGIAYPLLNPVGNQAGTQLRRDVPRFSRDRRVRYETVAEHGSVLDVHPQTRHLLVDTSAPLWIVPTVLDSDALVSADRCSISIVDPQSDAHGYASLPDSLYWIHVELNGRTVVLVIDPLTVNGTEARFQLLRVREFLMDNGASVSICNVDGATNDVRTLIGSYLFAGDTPDHMIQKATNELPALVEEAPLTASAVEWYVPGAPVPTSAVVPDGFMLMSDRIIFVPDNVVIAPSMILITAIAEDTLTGEHRVTLAHLQNGRWSFHSIDRTVIASRTEIIRLASYGFPINSHTADGLVYWLASFEQANIEVLPRHKTTTRMGWQADGSFLWGQTYIDGRTGESIDVAPDNQSPNRRGNDVIALRTEATGRAHIGFREGGTFDEWLSVIRKLDRYPRVAGALLTSLSAAVLEILSAPNFGYELAGLTSKGKTTSLRVAASAWGDPDERNSGSIVRGWNATRVLVERMAAFADSMPLILDDTKQARREDVPETIYMLANGEGRGRGSKEGMADTARWKSTFLSSGESPAVEYSRDGGTRARLLQVGNSPFGDSGREPVDAINECVMENFGHAGPLLVQNLIIRRDEWPQFRERLKVLRRYYQAQSGDNAVLGRLAAHIAVLHITCELANDALGLDWNADGVVSAIWDDIRATGAESDQALLAYEQIMAWASGHKREFQGLDINGVDGIQRVGSEGLAGRWFEDEGYIAFIPHRLDRALAEMDFEPPAIKKAWYDRGWLVTDGDGNRRQKSVRVDGHVIKTVALRLDAIDQTAPAEEDVAEKRIPVTSWEHTGNSSNQ